MEKIIEAKFPGIYESELVSEINKVGNYQVFPDETVLMDYGDYIKMVPMIITGSIKVLREDEQGREILLYYLYPGETCALSLSCCMAQKPSEVKAVTEDETEVINIPVEKVDEWMQKYSSWKTFIMETYRNRFYELLNSIDQLAFHKLDERLINYIKNKARAVNSDTINITHQVIAQELGTSREVISRLLKKLENEGFIELSRHKLRIKGEL